MHSDDPSGSQRLNQEAAKAAGAGAPSVSRSPTMSHQVDDGQPGVGARARRSHRSLEAGKNADVVLWSGNPFSVYARAEKVWVDGALMFDRLDPARQWHTDFELGFVPAEAGGAR